MTRRQRTLLNIYIVTAMCFILWIIPLSAGDLVKVRFGWQVPWATQGQLVQVLKNTGILEKNGIRGEFIGRTYGPLLNEIALAKEIDVVLTADQPAAALFAKDKGWLGIGRLMYNRTLTYVPPLSPIKTIQDLKGKTIGIPIGAAAERITIDALRSAGIDPGKDVRIINVGIREQGPLVLGGGKKTTWGNIDALSGFDPTPAIFEAQGLIRVLDVGKVCSLVVMNKAFIRKHPGIAVKMMKAFFDAYDYYRQNVKQANAWFMKEARLKGVAQKSCDIAASIEPNVWVKKRADIRVTFTVDDFAIMQKGADFLAPKVKKHIKITQYVTNVFAEEAR